MIFSVYMCLVCICGRGLVGEGWGGWLVACASIQSPSTARRNQSNPPHHQTPHPTNYPKPQQPTNRNNTTTVNNNKPTEAVAEVGKAQEKLLNKRAMALQKRDASLKKIQARSL